MSRDPTLRAATRPDLRVLWPAVSAARLFPDPHAFERSWERDSWRVRLAANGTAAVVEPWRDHLDILAIRGLWASGSGFSGALAELRELAASRGFDSLLSPLIAYEARGPYERAGMRLLEPLVSFRAPAEKLVGMPYALPSDTVVRTARPDDLDAIIRVDAECFEPFWAYGPERLAELLATDIAQVAALKGVVIGYTLSTVDRGSGTLGRIAIAPGHRGSGIGHALLLGSARVLAAAGAHSVSLCTQQANVAAHALYAGAGMRRLPGKLVFLMGDTGSGGR
ncbi:MAG: hypothetical protein CVT60_04095 [Actinobacteria bacterium HGW-Actinobacteria-10]|nr:MAG: hypothetical protein CVT60_04095 [Actinobacteria bacterium HGW-Actinobacteria-10]